MATEKNLKDIVVTVLEEDGVKHVTATSSTVPQGLIGRASGFRKESFYIVDETHFASSN